MSDSTELVEMLPLVSDSGSSQNAIHGYSFDTAIANSVNIADLKPIIMMANLATVSEEVQVSSQYGQQVDLGPGEGTSHCDLSDGVLRTHLMSSRSSTAAKTRKVTSEVYPDSETGVTYEILRGGTSRGKDKLIDSLGFTYNMKQGRGNKNLTYWWCAVRNTHLRCPASVVQRGTTFYRGKRKHEHLVGESTPKPHAHATVKKAQLGRPPGSTLFAKKAKKNLTSPNYVIIKEGSKAGKDLLRDKFGYTYTQKKICGDGRCYWICSIRNNHLRCPAMVIQKGIAFAEGSQTHKHMPGSKVPAGEHDVIPMMNDPEANFDEEEEDDGEEFDASSTGGDSMTQNYHSYNKTSWKNNPYFGTTPVKRVSKEHRFLARDSKRKDHATFLGPSCTINLTKCDDPSCNCRMVHCPFCDSNHFIPAKAGRVQDHLELTHFAHGVQYDDLMIVKCFQDCNMDRNFGHYHCVFCCQQILKRNSYARHMLRHMRKQGIPDRLLVLPDSKFPDVINAYGYEIPICKKVSCQPSREKHYHCPQCQQLCKERSLTVNHLWRCLQRKTSAVSGHTSDDEEMANTVDESQLNLHFSHVKNFKDLPLEKCKQPVCCNQMYHCRLCPANLFRPSYRQHLLAHYITHWKQRVPYKGYALLKCFHSCEGIDRRYFKTKFHFHCPICCKIILTKGSFEDHIKGCHMFKFGENLIEQNTEDMDTTMEEEVSILQELAPIHDNVEYMEDKLTAQAIALEEQRQQERKSRTPVSRKRVPQYGGKLRATVKKKAVRKIVSSALQVMGEAMSDDELDYMEGDSDLGDDIFGLNIDNEEIFDLGSVIFSEKFIEALSIVGVAHSVLYKVSVLTNTKLSQEGNRYLLSGKVEDLLEVKHIISKAINGFDESEESEEEPSPKKKKGKKTAKRTAKSTDDDSDEAAAETPVKGKGGKPGKAGNKSSDKRGKAAMPTAKDKRKSKKTSESFPYSEIKEIIEASKKTETGGKKGRGRPGKKLPVQKTTSKTETENSSLKETRTPSRYGTRGVKRNYLEMNSGGMRTQVKTEIEPDDNENICEAEEAQEEEVETISTRSGRRTRNKNVEQENLNGTNEEEDNENDENLDDSEQEELDQMSSDNEKDNIIDDMPARDKSLEESLTKKLIVVSPSKQDKITDSTVQGLKTSNVSSLVPAISKVGIRQMAFGKRKNKREVQEYEDIKKIAEEAKSDSLKCSLCDDYTAASFAEMTVHLMTFHHVYEPPRCDICEVDLDNYQSMKLHVDRRHGPRPYSEDFECEFEGCDKVFATSSGLRSHISSIHSVTDSSSKEKKHTCDKCDFKTNFIKDLYEHKLVDHEEPIKCEPCGKTFATYQTLKAHNDLKHTEGEPKTCSICHKQFSSLSELHRHLREHKSSLVCTVCNKSVTTKASLEAHMETHKPEEERNYRYVCSFCGKKFFLKTNYEDHLNKHTGNRPYKCDQCDKRFGFRSMLKKHKTFIHSNDRPFKCGYCMKGFKFMNLLNNHVTVHTNQSKHVCTTCSKSFSTASTLRFHQQKCSSNTHTNIPFDKIAPGQSLLKPQNALNMVQQQPMEIIHSGHIGEQVIETIVPATEHVVEMHMEIEQPMNTVNHGVGAVALNATNEVELGTVSEDMGNLAVPPGTEIEVYACSECRSTFDNFKDAELHVLTAHSNVA